MASFGNITSPAPTQGPVATAANYFVAINELTAHNPASPRQESVQQTQQSPWFQSLAPFLPYTPFALFVILFIIAFYIQVANRVRILQNVMTSLVIALMIAGIPTMITSMGQGTRQTVSAGPDEIPREVRVQENTPSSVLISWRTDAKHVGVVQLSSAPFNEKTAFMYMANNREEEVQLHTIQVDRLKDGMTYEFKILSGTTWYDNGGKYIQFAFHANPRGQ